MNYVRTNRKFTYAVRNEDAYWRTGGVIQNGLGETIMSWPVNWKNIIPTDIQPNSTFLCTHSFKEGIDALPIPRDNANYIRRGFNIYCNLATYTSSSNYVINVPGSGGTTQNSSLQGLMNDQSNAQNGFINVMQEETNSYYTVNNAYGLHDFPLVAYFQSGKYTAQPREFEVFSPENHSLIAIRYGEFYAPYTLAQIQASGMYGSNSNTLTYTGGTVGVNTFSGLGPVAQFRTVDTANNIDPAALWGTHIFEFELVEKVPSANRV